MPSAKTYRSGGRVIKYIVHRMWTKHAISGGRCLCYTSTVTPKYGGWVVGGVMHSRNRPNQPRINTYRAPCSGTRATSSEGSVSLIRFRRESVVFSELDYSG